MEKISEALGNMTTPIAPGSAAEALAKGNYLFVYLTSENCSTMNVGTNILRMGLEDTDKFLICYRDLCRMHRLVADSAIGEKKNENMPRQ